MDNEIITLLFKGESRECFADQLIVKIAPQMARKGDQAQIYALISEALGTSLSFHVLVPFDERGVGLIELNKGSDLTAAATALEQNSEILYAEPNNVSHMAHAPAVTPTDPLFSKQWALLTLQAPAAWSITRGRRDVLIAVIDTGIPISGSPPRLSHEDLNDSDRFFLGTNYISPGDPPTDDQGHGTHVAGIAAGEGNNGKGIAGVCWNCNVFICKVFDKQVNGSEMNLYKAVQESIAFARGKGWRPILNYSGRSRNYSQTSEETAKVAQEGGALLCAAAGNDSGGVGYPAALSTHPDGSAWYSNIIAVSATTSSDELASFSNRGIQINVAAPGVDILSTMPNYHVTMNDPPSNKQMNYDFLSGTSMATPVVSGLAALVWSAFPGLTPSQVRERLQQTAVDLPPPGRDAFFGFGRVNAWSALQPLPVPPPPPPLPPWENPQIQQWMNEWIQQADRCLKRHYPGAYIDRWGRGCGRFGGTVISCNLPPDTPPGWDSYHYLWASNIDARYYPYTVREYIERRQRGETFASLAHCK